MCGCHGNILASGSCFSFLISAKTQSSPTELMRRPKSTWVTCESQAEVGVSSYLNANEDIHPCRESYWNGVLPWLQMKLPLLDPSLKEQFSFIFRDILDFVI